MMNATALMYYLKTSCKPKVLMKIWQRKKFLCLEKKSCFFKHDDCNEEELMQHFQECVSFYFYCMFHGSKGKFKTITQEKLSRYLVMRFPDKKTNMCNWKDVLEWHKSLEGDTQDEIAWRSRQLVFDDIATMKAIAKVF